MLLVYEQMIFLQKQTQRKAGKLARRSLSPQERTAYSADICRRISSTEVFRNAKHIMAYAAFGAEVSVDALAEQYPEKRFFYPVCLPDFEMLAARPLDDSGWEIGDYGIRTPIPEYSEVIFPEEIDLVLVPCTAFDEACRRVGMGAGYYDRYLTRCVHAVKMGIAFECQKVEQAAVDGFDVPLDCYVTERAVYNAQCTMHNEP